MIITCEKCSTKFNLDESLLNENGSKVRCCLCKHVFTAYPPVEKDEPEFENQPDLDHEDEDDLDLYHDDDLDLDFDFDFDSDVEPESGLELEDFDVETDFDAGSKEFDLKEDSVVEDSTELDFFPGEDSESKDNFDAEDGADSDFESGLDLDFNTDLELEFNDEDVNEFDEKPESLDDFENKEPADGLKDAALTTEENFEIELDFQNDDESVDGLGIDEQETESGDINLQGGDVSEEDEALELDLSEFDQDFDKQSETPSPVHDDMEKVSADEETGLETGKNEQLSLDKDENIEKPAAGLILSDSIPPDSTDAAVDAEQEKVQERSKLDEEVSLDAVPEGFEIDDELEKPVKKPGRAVFVVLFLAIILLAGYSITIMKGINIPYVSDFKIPFLTQYLTSNTHVKSFPVSLIPDKKSINGRFVTNSSAGTLFVITGKIINKSEIPCSHVRVTGTLIAENKIKVKNKTVFCGNLISEDKLGSLKMEAIDGILARKSGNNSSNVNIAPGRFVSFMIVFSKLPDNLQNFTVNVAGFDKGKIKK